MDKESMQEAVATKAGKLTERAERVTHKLDEIGHSAQDLYSRGKERAVEFRDTFDEYVQDSPMKSVLIAAGVGLALGLLLSPRR